MSVNVAVLTLAERIKRGNDILWSIWLDAAEVADDQRAWVRIMESFDRGRLKLLDLYYQARREGYVECCYGDEKYRCFDDRYKDIEKDRICFVCTFNPPDGCSGCDGRDFWFNKGAWSCSKCCPKPEPRK